MPKCSKIRKKKQEVCIGDMRDLITLQNRSIQPPVFGSVDFTENFQNSLEVYSLIQTSTGKTFFDGVSTDQQITHTIYIRFDKSVTAETWVLFEDRRIDILKVEDLDERHDFMKLTCNERGIVDKAASEA
jgi:SPP1 family predicted phage head-tail adaptor